MRACLCMCTYARAPACVLICVHCAGLVAGMDVLCLFLQACVHACLFLLACVCSYLCTHECVEVIVCVCARACVCTCARAHVFIVQLLLQAWQLLLQAWMCFVSNFVCVHACLCLREIVCSNLCTHECDCVGSCFCAPVHACSSVCIVQVLLQAWKCFVSICANVRACMFVSVCLCVLTLCMHECVEVIVCARVHVRLCSLCSPCCRHACVWCLFLYACMHVSGCVRACAHTCARMNVIVCGLVSVRLCVRAHLCALCRSCCRHGCVLCLFLQMCMHVPACL